MSTRYSWEGKGRYGSFRLRMNVWMCTGKTVKSLENTCHTWPLLRWCFTTKRRYIKYIYLYLYLYYFSSFLFNWPIFRRSLQVRLDPQMSHKQELLGILGARFFYRPGTPWHRTNKALGKEFHRKRRTCTSAFVCVFVRICISKTVDTELVNLAGRPTMERIRGGEEPRPVPWDPRCPITCVVYVCSLCSLSPCVGQMANLAQ